jgi:hypothetical protein
MAAAMLAGDGASERGEGGRRSPGRAPRSAVTRLAWVLCLLSILLAAATLFLAAVNGESLLDLIADHHAVGIMDALVLAPIGP